jgi:hypothetical protein
MDDAPTSSAHMAELFAKVRDNGRIVRGSNKVFDATFSGPSSGGRQHLQLINYKDTRN